ncbi:MAG: 23S rRNA (adenine(2503)-C(2))-methyltransferase RlmN [Prevotellaceae bacterium]|jgi:23S rRNA (adenine2503-C2)-methyltransferase|nr:23S rRNA (adenine(2503)-C(2))-methyltransferase RlmN [Prevotellaceae bacterium]
MEKITTIHEYLLGKTHAELIGLVKDFGWPAFTGGQIADWLYKKHVTDIDEMTNLSKAMRAQLCKRFETGGVAPAAEQTSKDGTRKYLFPIRGGRSVETVVIPDAGRATLCVSSQVGCRMGCRFCMTARQGFRANLPAGEIINQFRSVRERDALTNAVFMGMGEPMDNLDELLKSLQILTSPWGFAWSPRRITVSTIGIEPAVKRFLEESECHLAVSVHNPFDDERQELMPIQKAYPLQSVIDLLRQYDFSGQRRVSFEYILFNRRNDTPRHAQALAALLQGLECRVNLIRFHPIPDSALRPSPDGAVERFKNLLLRQGVMTTVRASRGQDIMAACGLLSTACAGQLLSS